MTSESIDPNQLFYSAYDAVKEDKIREANLPDWIIDEITTCAVSPEIFRAYGKPVRNTKYFEIKSLTDFERMTRILIDRNWWKPWGFIGGMFGADHARLIVWLLEQGYLARPDSTDYGDDNAINYFFYTKDLVPVAIVMGRRYNKKDPLNSMIAPAAYHDGQTWIWSPGESPEERGEKKEQERIRRRAAQVTRDQREDLKKMDPGPCLDLLFPDKQDQEAFLRKYARIQIFTAKSGIVDGAVPINYFLGLVCQNNPVGFLSNTPEGQAAREIAWQLFQFVPEKYARDWWSTYGVNLTPKLLDPIGKVDEKIQQAWVREFKPDLIKDSPWIPLLLNGQIEAARAALDLDKQEFYRSRKAT